MPYNKPSAANAPTGFGGPPGTKLTPQRVVYLEKVLAAIELRKRGKNFQEIAATCGWKNRNGAYLAITRYLQQSLREGTDELIQLEVERLDQLLDAVWTSSMSGDPKSVAAALKIMERRAKLLGLDKPVSQEIKVTHTEPPQAPADFSDFAKKMYATLQIAGALELPMAPEHQYLSSGTMLLDSLPQPNHPQPAYINGQGINSDEEAEDALTLLASQ